MPISGLISILDRWIWVILAVQKGCYTRSQDGGDTRSISAGATSRLGGAESGVPVFRQSTYYSRRIASSASAGDFRIMQRASGGSVRAGWLTYKPAVSQE